MNSIRINRIVAVCALVIVLLLINWKIAAKERHLSDGALVYLELAPVDPRSLMQGDYMALRFQLAQDITKAVRALETNHTPSRSVEPADGFVEVMLDDRKIGRFVGVTHNASSLSGKAREQDRLWLRYRIRHSRVKFATNAFFFQEGHAQRFNNSRYGQFRVDDHGDLLLTAMCTEHLECLGASL